MVITVEFLEEVAGEGGRGYGLSMAGVCVLATLPPLVLRSVEIALG